MKNITNILFCILVLIAAACESKTFDINEVEGQQNGATDQDLPADNTRTSDTPAAPTPTVVSVEIGSKCSTGKSGVCAAGKYTLNAAGAVECVQQVQPSSEICDGLDNNCDGKTDEGVTQTVYADHDQDGFGLASEATVVCVEKGLPKGYAIHDGDCNDSPLDVNADGKVDGFDINPSAEEICDHIDNNCDSVIDEGCAPSPEPTKFQLPEGAEDGFWIMVAWPNNQKGQTFMGVEYKAVCEIASDWDPNLDGYSSTSVVEVEISDPSNFCGLRFNTAYANKKWLAMGNGDDAEIQKDAHIYILTQAGKKTEVTAFVKPWPTPDNQGSSALLEWGDCK